MKEITVQMDDCTYKKIMENLKIIQDNWFLHHKREIGTQPILMSILINGSDDRAEEIRLIEENSIITI